MSKNKMILIGSYGTLRTGMGNHRFISNSKSLGIGWTTQKFHLTASGIPFVDKNMPTHKVRIEVFEVEPQDLPLIDRLEGHPEWYKREEASVLLDNGEEVTAEIYFNEDKGNTFIESGDFADYKR